MEALAGATSDEEAEFPNWIYSFHMWMLAQNRKESTCKNYASQIRMLYEDDGKSPASMATQEYFRLTRESYKNKSGNGQRSAAVRLFIEFYEARKQSGEPLQKSDGGRMYQVKPRDETEQRGKRFQDKLMVEAEAPEARQLRLDLGLPDDWNVVCRERASGDLFAAISPGGSAYSSRQAVDKRLNRSFGLPPVAAAAKPVAAKAAAAKPTPRQAAQRARRALEEQASVGEAKAPKGSTKAAASKPDKTAKTQPPAAKAVSTTDLMKALKGTPVRRRILLQDALMTAFCSANVAAGVPPLGDGRRREAFVVRGRDPDKKLTGRIHGLYVAEDTVLGGRPVYRKADAEKPTYICYNEEKSLWRVCHQLDAKGDFAKAKDKSDRPWMASKAWKVFDGKKEYVEDPDVKVILVDASTMSTSEEVEICLPVLPAGAFGTPTTDGAAAAEPASKRPRSEA